MFLNNVVLKPQTSLIAPLIKGNVLILTGPSSFDPKFLDLEETIKNELSELNDTLESDTDMIQNQIGEFCVLENSTENSFRRYVFLKI